MFSGQIEFAGNSAKASSTLTLTCCIDKQLSLRPLDLTDTQALFVLTDINRAYLKRWLPWLEDVQQAEDTESFIRMSLEKAEARSEFISAICYDQTIVGLVGLHNISWQNRSGSIGYWLSAAHQGNGFMTKACRALLDYSFTTLNLNRIDICCATQNCQSEAVAKRLGLTYEGLLREAEWLYDHFVDHKVYAVLQREWQM